MSSIFGIYSINQNRVSSEDLTRMEHALNHWNADKVALWASKSVGMGHLMLYNTPESLYEVLPLVDHTNQLTITADARIDNREELFKILAVSKVAQADITDSQLILLTYIKYKEDCVKYLIGDFAFAIWDEKEQQLFCARDQMGIRPFFYYKDAHTFAFASEKKGLLALNCLDKTGSDEYLFNIISNIGSAPEKTYYKNIYKLVGAHTLVIKDTRMRIARYWELDTEKVTHYSSSHEYVEAFREKFAEAISCRLRTAYNVGCELSGGLDSSGITCLAADMLHQQNKEITTYSYVLPEGVQRQGIAQDSEENYAAEVCSYGNIDNVVKVQSSGYKNFLEEIDLSLFIGDGPDYAAQVWNWPIKKTAGENNTRVLLSGYPGDELVTNYNPFRFMEYASMQSLFKYFKAARTEVDLKQAMKFLLLSKLSAPVKILFRNYLLTNSVNALRNSKYNYLTDEYFDKVKHNIPILHQWPKSYKDMQKSMISDPIRAHRLESEIHNSLINKVVTCFPMADIRLMEFVLSVPVHEKASRTADRWLYRRAMQGYMPQSVTDRRDKTGAVLPFVEYEWVGRQTDAKSWILKFDSKKQKLPFFNYDKFVSRYDWQIANNANYKQWIQPSRNKIVESVIRWLELNN